MGKNDASDDDEFFDAEEEFGGGEACSSTSGFPLHRAAWAGDAGAVRRLSAGASREALTALDPHGNTALHLAALRGHVPCIEALLDAGCPVRVKSARGWLAIEEAVSGRSLPAALALHAAMAAESEARLAEKKALLLRTLDGLPAFSLQLKWELGSRLPGARCLLVCWRRHVCVCGVVFIPPFLLIKL